MAKPWLHAATGYYYIKTSHPNGRRRIMPYHRYLMEEHLGRHLGPDEQVHHINGDKTDNRIENLEIISPADHTRHHHTPERMKGAHAAIERIHGVSVSTPEERAEARRLYAEGVPIKEIAERMGRKYVRVWKWINHQENFVA